jgi:phenylalanyl-tRNA synthetase beta chain
MKLSINWLKEYISLSETPQEIAKLLTQSGLEVVHVQSFEPIPGNLAGMLIGQIVSCTKHPNADKLSLTQVNIGAGQPLSIVCGAPNVAIGQKVVVAPIGTTLHTYTGEQILIKAAKIRGEVSEGMLCAADEIGLGPSHEGILVLNTSLAPGTPANAYFNLQPDTILTIDLTPNRIDACSHLGVARELRALLDRPIQYPSLLPQPLLSQLTPTTALLPRLPVFTCKNRLAGSKINSNRWACIPSTTWLILPI